MASVPIDVRELAITPVFKTIQLECVPKSEDAGYAVMEWHEVVEIRIAGSRTQSLVAPTDAFWRREGNRTITYAERWPEQYRQFKEGSPQEALGTPLEMLQRFGVTPEQVSLCRALKIYSVEALSQLQSDKLKSLGMHQNKLREAAATFMAERNSGAGAMMEIEALKAKIAALEAKSTEVPAVEPTEPEIDEALARADSASAGLKDEIQAITGTRPRGNPSEATLRSMLDELKG